MKVHDLDKAKAMLKRTVENIDKMMRQHKLGEMESKVLVFKDEKEVYRGENITEVAEYLDIHYTTVCNCMQESRENYQGYSFERWFYRKEDLDG